MHAQSQSKFKSKQFRMALFLVVAIVGVLADLGSKHWIFGKLGRPGEHAPDWIIDGVFGFQTSLNQGALFGIGQGQITLFVTLSLIALVGVAWWVWTDLTRSVFLSSVLGLVAAGIVGNLWDRVGLHGMVWTQFDATVWSCDPEMVGEPVHAVRDWILVMLGSYAWPNFNIADSCLVCSAILLGAYALFTPSVKPEDLAKEIEEENAQASENADA